MLNINKNNNSNINLGDLNGHWNDSFYLQES